jgi:hypothetical protein
MVLLFSLIASRYSSCPTKLMHAIRSGCRAEEDDLARHDFEDDDDDIVSLSLIRFHCCLPMKPPNNEADN